MEISTNLFGCSLERCQPVEVTQEIPTHDLRTSLEGRQLVIAADKIPGDRPKSNAIESSQSLPFSHKIPVDHDQSGLGIVFPLTGDALIQ
jgi:hypothetical protein